jgi:hypothetical protein
MLILPVDTTRAEPVAPARRFSTLRARVMVVVLVTLMPAFALLIFNAADERERALAVTRESALSTVRLVSSQQTQLLHSTE